MHLDVKIIFDAVSTFTIILADYTYLSPERESESTFL
jgi:hypothetical protein